MDFNDTIKYVENDLSNIRILRFWRKFYGNY